MRTTGLAPFCGRALPLPLEQGAILANQQLEVFALFGGELEEDQFAFRVFEAVTVALEEAVRGALAADADHQRLAVVHTLRELFRAGREQAVGRAFEKQEGRPRLEQRILLQQLLVARLELAEVLFFLSGELLEHTAAARILGHPRAAGIELQAAPLRGDGDSQRVAREQQLGGAALRRRRTAGPAGFARAMDLQDALPRREVARRRHFLEQGFDVRAQELERPVAGLADEMKVPRMAIGMLEAEAAFAKIHLARDARLLHPLERAVDGGAADFLVFAPDEIVEIVGGEVPLLAEEHVDDEIALSGSFAAGGPEAVEVRRRRFHGQLSTEVGPV